MNDAFTKRVNDTHTEETYREDGHMKTEAEIGVMSPQAKKCQEPPEARSKEPSEGTQPWRHLDLGILTSETMNKYISTV